MNFYFFRASGLSPYVSSASISPNRAKSALDEQAPNQGTLYFQISGKGRKWPHLLGQPARDDIPLFRKDVVGSIRQEGLTGIEFFASELECSDSKSLTKESCPGYYWGRIFARMRAAVTVHRTLKRVTEDSNGLLDIHNLLGLEPLEYKVLQSGDEIPDFFYFSNINSTTRCCSDRFYNLAIKEKWTNITFYKPNDQGVVLM